MPRQAYLGGLRDTLTHLAPAEVLPAGEYGGPAVLRLPAAMRHWALAALQDERLAWRMPPACFGSSRAHSLGRGWGSSSLVGRKVRTGGACPMAVRAAAAGDRGKGEPLTSAVQTHRLLC